MTVLSVQFGERGLRCVIMKLAVLVLVFAVVLLGEIAAYSHYEESLAKFGVGDLGRGHEYVRIKKLRTQVSVPSAGFLNNLTWFVSELATMA